jgi:hypothetical protein
VIFIISSIKIESGDCNLQLIAFCFGNKKASADNEIDEIERSLDVEGRLNSD